jgi:hypothetical protein
MKSPEELGLSKDVIFTPRALSYWQQFPSYVFITEVMYAVQDEVSVIHQYVVSVMREESPAAFSSPRLLQQLCEDTLARINRVNDALALASLYSTSLEQVIHEQE